MELAALGGSLWLATQLLPKGEEKLVPEDDCSHDVHGALQGPDEFLHAEYKRAGMIAPQRHHVHARLPFRHDQPPYDIWRPSDPEHIKNPSDHMFDYAVRAQSHHRRDFEQTLRSGHEYFINSRGGAWTQLFTRELRNPSDPAATTGLIEYSWLPPNPQDADFVRAGALARKIPRDPSIFAPDSTFYNAPGLPFRYAVK